MKHLRIISLMLLSAVLFSGMWSCKNDNDDELDGYIFDFAPVTLSIMVDAEDGSNLLNGCSQEFYEGFSMTYNGETYQPSALDTRFYDPYFYGLEYVSYPGEENSYFSFGEFDGYRFEGNMVFRMPDGEEHDIYIIRKGSVKGKDVSIVQTVKVDGNVIDQYTDGSPDITLTFVYSE